ncbi:MAG TPA: hypothetical protein VGY48_15485 [Vicinamibacterales bacterium]|jgi:hypothetical protein|nr:hypothetical protein [Vicinamibacterales bacterium]
MANPNTPVLATFLQQIAPLAKQLGITTLVIVGKDPQTGETALFGDTSSMVAVRDFTEAKFVEKLGVVAETSWNDV